MKTAMMMLTVPAAVMAFSDSQEQNWAPGGDETPFSAWRCGHDASQSTYSGRNNANPKPVLLQELKALHNPKAGIVFLQDGSLDHVRTAAAELDAVDEATKAKYLANDFSSLFCYDYISGYKNGAADGAVAGMCIQNMDVGSKWEAVLAADESARKSWNFFGTDYGFQKSVGVEKGHPTPDYPTMWGSGKSGSNPSNWCGAYMKETLCHVAFPQYAEPTAPADLLNNGLGARVRPVCKDWCESVMDNCNRKEPACYECGADWANNYTNPYSGESTGRFYSLDFDNSLYCAAWNRGYDQFDLARAGTGVGSGADEEDEKYCAAWDAAPSMAPMSLFAVVLAVLVAVL